ncbi:MAG: hypothetical protein OXD43_04520 [Bacteroidetes bacterium]|nr:hypothetical protein [Bacteroidota bacterium]
MDYHYEVLDANRFQQLVQALIVGEFPTAQCMPVGQPDGGRDAFSFHGSRKQSQFIVFQVKFSRDPLSKNPRDIINALIKSEKAKVAELIQRGLNQYILVTNVQGTGHLDFGSIDEACKFMAAEFGISAQVWWRDDLSRRLDGAGHVKWSFPEILKATDILPFLLAGTKNAHQGRADLALRSFVAAQYRSDKNVRFKQLNLNHKLTTLFVDLPIGAKEPQVEGDSPCLPYVGDANDIRTYVRRIYRYDDSAISDIHEVDYPFRAASFFLQMPISKGASRFVVEGAPGQGKSTVSQFLCQVNRLRILQDVQELDSIKTELKEAPVRIPFRVDLRDFAAWFSGRDPYEYTTEKTIKRTGSLSLEAFLATQVTRESGGIEIKEDELVQLFERSHSLIIFDGFDEVADLRIRSRIADEICKGTDRLSVHAESLQIIVTSRPAAFSNSPGFPEDEWFHLRLKDLHHPNIEEYSKKWISASELSPQDGDQISLTLRDKLDQPHIRDLARNPMQLSILLHLIHMQGVALPEKRTTLYEEYIKLFFNREAEKSDIVRNHRELVLSIHGMLAWVLHTQVECGEGSGNIDKTGLHDVIKAYLESKGHDPTLAKDLLEGTVERVGALVSRVEGRFEFEVQPLREFFVARHLYETAPYSPAGSPCNGTKLDRFEALASSFYWTNVTRFFCGFYDAGELASLVDGIKALGDLEDYGLLNHPRRLAMMLLSDHVFSQAPKVVKRLIDFIVDEPGFQRLISSTRPRARRDMGLPSSAGNNALFEACKKKLVDEADPSRRQALRVVMAENADKATLKSIVVLNSVSDAVECNPLSEAMDLGIVESFDIQEIQRLTKNNLDLQISWLLRAGHFELIHENPIRREMTTDLFFRNRLAFLASWRRSDDTLNAVELVARLIRPRLFAYFLSEADENYDGDGQFACDYIDRLKSLGQQLFQEDTMAKYDSIGSLVQLVSKLMTMHRVSWGQTLEPWSRLVDHGLERAPESELMVHIAIVSTAVGAEPNMGAWDEEEFSATAGLVSRLFFARHKWSDADWWRARLHASTSDTLCTCLAVLLSWGMPEVIEELKADIESNIEELSKPDFSELWSLVDLISTATSDPGRRVPEDWFSSIGSLSPRTALLLILRVKDWEVRRRLSYYYFGNYVGDDIQVLRYAARAATAASDSIDWDYLCHLSKIARQAGIPALVADPRLRLRALGLPLEVAKTVLTEFDHHCEQIVSLSEQAYATAIAKSASTVKQRADSEKWFSECE